MEEQAQDAGATLGTGDILPAKSVRDTMLALQEGKLGKGSLRITKVILDRPQEVVGMTLSEFARTAEVSDGMVIKVLKQAGLTGFQQLKLALAYELGSPLQSIHEGLETGDDYGTIRRKIFGANVQALLDTEQILTDELLGNAVDILDAAAIIDIYGIGSAAPIAEDAYYRLIRIGLNPRISTDSHLQVTTASLATHRSAVLTISHSGSTLETLDATRVAKEAGARVVVISGYADAPLHKYADVVLQTKAIETKFRTEAMTSRIAQLAIVDTLIGALALKRYDSAVATVNKTQNALTLKRV